MYTYDDDNTKHIICDQNNFKILHNLFPLCIYQIKLEEGGFGKDLVKLSVILSGWNLEISPTVISLLKARFTP